MKGNFRDATLNEYVVWLRGYLREGNLPTHYYDYPFGRESFLYVTGKFSLEGECGARAKHIIVDSSAELDRYKRVFGHNVLHYMGRYESEDGHGIPAAVVPVYNDDAFLGVRGIDKFIESFVMTKMFERLARQGGDPLGKTTTRKKRWWLPS